MSQETSTPQETPQLRLSNLLFNNSDNILEVEYKLMQDYLRNIQKQINDNNPERLFDELLEIKLFQQKANFSEQVFNEMQDCLKEINFNLEKIVYIISDSTTAPDGEYFLTTDVNDDDDDDVNYTYHSNKSVNVINGKP
jgi:hypothetical protein